MSAHVSNISDAEFESSVLKAATPVVVDFWAPWCGPCLAIGPTLESLAADYKDRAVVAKINVDENANTAATFGVRSIPFLAVFKNGQLVSSVVGAVPKTKLIEMLESALK